DRLRRLGGKISASGLEDLRFETGFHQQSVCGPQAWKDDKGGAISAGVFAHRPWFRMSPSIHTVQMQLKTWI
ncbi:hypothetical protein AVEN_257955-1, partial [Araneus ventricosus]